MLTTLSREYAAVEAAIARRRGQRLAKSDPGRQREHDTVLAAMTGLRAAIVAKAVATADGAVLRQLNRGDLAGLREPQRQVVGEAVALWQIHRSRGAARG